MAAEVRVFPRHGGARVVVGPGDATRGALSLYQPASRAGRLARALAGGILSRFLTRPARAPEVAALACAESEAVIREVLGEPSAAVSYYVGGGRGKVTARVHRARETLAYVRIARETLAAGLLDRERTALARLAEAPALAGAVPAVIAAVERGGARYLFLGPGPAGARSRARLGAPTETDEGFVRALFTAGARDLPLSAYAEAHAMARRMTALASEPQLGAAHRAVVRAWNAVRECLAAAGVRAGPVHGDFAPWNTLGDRGGRIFVFDWEYADELGPALFDLCHAVRSPAMLVRGVPAPRVIADLLAALADDASLLGGHAAALGIPRERRRDYLVLYLIEQVLRLAVEEGAREGRRRALLDDLVLALECASARPGGSLVSAYACEPGKGSEPAVGWQWARTLARRGDDCWVLTRANNRAAIEAAWQGEAPVRFLYYDLPAWARWWKRGGRGVRLYYLLWQWGAARLAREVHRSARFAAVHHVTFVGVRQPSFLGSLGVPFVFGPVGGGERAPWRLRPSMGLRGMVADTLRDAANALVRFDPMMLRTFAAAERIYATSPETAALLPRRFRAKVREHLAIAWEGETPAPRRRRVGRPPRLLFAGRLVAWKGLHLALDALALVAEPTLRLTVVGAGPDAGRLRRRARRLGIESRIDWLGALPRERLLALYGEHDVFVYPSLHDSGGMVVLEALAVGLPVLCLDRGGPGQIVDAGSGRVIASERRGSRAVAADLAAALDELTDPRLRARLARGARARARALSWEALVAEVRGPPLTRG